MASPFRTKNAQLHAKIEAAFTSITNTECFAGFNPTYKPNWEQNDDESYRGTFGKLPTIAGGVSADLGFSFYLKGSGTPGTAPEFDKVLKLCGFSVTNVPATSDTYKPDTTVVAPGSVSWNADGARHVVEGAFGTLKIAGESGKLAVCTADFTGAYEAFADAALISNVTYQSSIPQPLKGVTVTIMDADPQPKLKSFSIDIGNVISLRPSAKAASAFAGAVLADRRIKGQIVMTAPDQTALDAYVKAANNTQGVLSWAWGATSNVVTITVGAGVFSSVVPSDQNGRLMLTVDFSAALIGGATEGDDLSIMFS